MQFKNKISVTIKIENRYDEYFFIAYEKFHKPFKQFINSILYPIRMFSDLFKNIYI